MAEIWKKIIDFPNYEISSHGKLKNITTNYMLSEIYKAGYVKAVLYKDGKSSDKYVHCLVAQAFIPNPNNLPTVNHIDFDKKHNKIENLEWATHRQQQLHNQKKTTKKKEITNNMRKVWQIDRKTNIKIQLYNSCKEAANAINCDASRISKACKDNTYTCGGYKWKYDQDFEEENKGEIWKHSDKYNIDISNKGRLKFSNGRITFGNDTTEGYMLDMHIYVEKNRIAT